MAILKDKFGVLNLTRFAFGADSVGFNEGKVS
jgi:hypothetical protein